MTKQEAEKIILYEKYSVEAGLSQLEWGAAVFWLIFTVIYNFTPPAAGANWWPVVYTVAAIISTAIILSFTYKGVSWGHFFTGPLTFIHFLWQWRWPKPTRTFDSPRKELARLYTLPSLSDQQNVVFDFLKMQIALEGKESGLKREIDKSQEILKSIKAINHKAIAPIDKILSEQIKELSDLKRKVEFSLSDIKRDLDDFVEKNNNLNKVRDYMMGLSQIESNKYLIECTKTLIEEANSLYALREKAILELNSEITLATSAVKEVSNDMILQRVV
jgi:hypothetical protein